MSHVYEDRSQVRNFPRVNYKYSPSKYFKIPLRVNFIEFGGYWLNGPATRNVPQYGSPTFPTLLLTILSYIHACIHTPAPAPSLVFVIPFHVSLIHEFSFLQQQKMAWFLPPLQPISKTVVKSLTLLGL